VVCDSYEVEGHRFGVRSTSEAFGSWISYALGAYRTEPTPDDESLRTYSVVVDDGAPESDRVGRGFNILYAGTMDVTRTLDRGFLARCLLREIDAFLHPARDDAVFLRAGVIEANGCVALVPSFLVPMLCAARRRAEKRGIHAPGGTVATLELGSGDLISPHSSIEVPPDAIETLERYVLGGTNDVRERFPIEDGERRRLDAVIGLRVEEGALAEAKPRSEALLELSLAAMNLQVLGGNGFRAIAEAVANSASVAVNWSSKDEMLDALADATRLARHELRIAP
jgi:hypothetical protein